VKCGLIFGGFSMKLWGFMAAMVYQGNRWNKSKIFPEIQKSFR
jgi:hypothetical protein